MKFYLTSQKYAHSNPNLTAYEIDQISKAYLGKLSTVCTVEVWLPSKIKKTKCAGAGICRGGSIVINIADVPTLQFFRKMLGKSFLMVALMQPDYPKLVIKDL
ncbi:hypothetical protein AEL96_02985 [Lactobacillus crispatus]|uniref:hypothetical protein n=1 Tax=Lactobacillus crispatus TaxID=47770 RepID=UPI0007620A4B|nr:hypothetical protein [Lactobacillus crispatus]KWU06473.1 hypothetical protein AEL96_02985 [Lactobacillus crispatus]